ncbi:hypothetical protein V7O67_09465 [Methanolobus sp. ZRKC4]
MIELSQNKLKKEEKKKEEEKERKDVTIQPGTICLLVLISSK